MHDFVVVETIVNSDTPVTTIFLGKPFRRYLTLISIAACVIFSMFDLGASAEPRSKMVLRQCTRPAPISLRPSALMCRPDASGPSSIGNDTARQDDHPAEPVVPAPVRIAYTTAVPAAAAEPSSRQDTTVNASDAVVAARAHEAQDFATVVLARRDELSHLPADHSPLDLAIVEERLGDALLASAKRKIYYADAYGAADAYQKALGAREFDHDPRAIAGVELKLGRALTLRGEHEIQPNSLNQAIAVLQSAFNSETSGRAEAEAALGVAMRDLGEREADGKLLGEAIVHLKSAVANTSRNDYPEAWAAAEIDLGIALRMYGLRHWDEGGADSVAAIEAGLEVQTEATHPYEHWVSEVELGQSLTMLHLFGGTESPVVTRHIPPLTRSWKVISAALEHLDRTNSPLAWGIAQDALGFTLRLIGDDSGDVRWYEASRQSEGAALAVFTPGWDDVVRARALSRMGTVSWRLGEATWNKRHLETAVEALQAAAAIRTKEWVPLDWAETEINRAEALERLARFDQAMADVRLNEALKTMIAVLNVIKPEHDPDLWAYAENAFADAAKGRFDEGTGLVEAEVAVQGYRAAVTEWTRVRRPMNWSLINRDLGSVLAGMAIKKGDISLLQDAIVADRQAVDGFKQVGDRSNWSMATWQLADALKQLGQQTGDAKPLHQAVVLYGDLLAFYDVLGETPNCDCASDVRKSFGDALLTLGEKHADDASINAAIALYYKQIEANPQEKDLSAWGQAKTGLGRALLLRGVRDSNVDRLQEAVVTLRSVVTAMHDDYYVLIRADAEIALGDALRLIGERTGESVWLDEARATYKAAVNERGLREAATGDWTAANTRLQAINTVTNNPKP